MRTRWWTPLIVLLAVAATACSAGGPSVTVEQVAEDTPDTEDTPEPEPEDTPDPEPEDTPDPGGDPDPSELGDELFGDLFTADEFGSSFDDETTTCIGLALIERLGIAEVVALDESDTITPEAGRATVEALFECVDSEVIGMELTAAILSELGFPAPADSEACLVETYSDPEAVGLLVDIFARVGDVDFEDVPPDDQRAVIGQILGCIGIGDILQGELQQSGESLSAESVECLNVEGADLVELLIASGGADFEDIPAEQQAEVVGIFLECLSVEEIELLGGL